jgi:hypothetical protein
MELQITYNIANQLQMQYATRLISVDLGCDICREAASLCAIIAISVKAEISDAFL